MPVIGELKSEGKRRAKRLRGTGAVIKIKDKEGNESRYFYVQYYANGRQVRESSKSESRMVAERMLQKRLGELASGQQPAIGAAKLKYDELRDALYLDYRINKKKSLKINDAGELRLDSVKRLDGFFTGWKVNQITADAIQHFVLDQQKKDKANATINRSLAALKRMFHLAKERGKLQIIPHIEMLKEAAPRKGFVSVDEFRRLRNELPDYLKPVLTLGYFTGMRLGEIRNLRWSDINLKEAVVLLGAEQTKGDEPRTVPLNQETILMLKMIKKEGEFVFGGQGPIIDFRTAWRSACVRAGLGRWVKGDTYEGLIFHDLRRSAVRELIRAGVPEKIAMSISGHRTRSVFDRYNIVSTEDLRKAVQRRDAYLQTQHQPEPKETVAYQ